jgi:hypothetical protein
LDPLLSGGLGANVANSIEALRELNSGEIIISTPNINYGVYSFSYILKLCLISYNRIDEF